MDNLDGTNLVNMKHWLCGNGHIMGVIERVQTGVRMADESTLRYFTKRLLIFRVAVDLNAEVPAEIEVVGALDGRMLSMVWKCSIPGCGCMKEWHPDEDALDWLKQRYGKKIEER